MCWCTPRLPRVPSACGAWHVSEPVAPRAVGTSPLRLLVCRVPMGRQRGPPVPRWRQLLRAGCRWLLSLSGTVLQGLWWLWRLVWVGTAGGGGPPLPQGPSSTCVGSKRGVCPEPGAGAWGQGSAGGVPLCTRGAGVCGLVRLGQMGEEVTTPSDSMAGGSGPSSLGAGLRHCRVLPSESAGDVGTFLWALPSLGQV